MSETTTATLTAQVRYFAAASEAAGTPAEDVPLPADASAADLVAAMSAAHGERLRRVLAISSLLVDDVVREDLSTPLTPAAREGSSAIVRVDVLPPFAGG